MTTSPDCGADAVPLRLARTTTSERLAVPALVLLLLLAVIGSLCIGVYPVPLAHVGQMLLELSLPEPLRPTSHWSAAEQAAIQIVRLPRVLMAVLAGAGLGLAGTSLQGMMRNPLVGPDLVGASSGAACGGMLAILLDWPSWGLLAGSFGGGFLALLSVWLLSRLSRSSGALQMVLAGIVVSALFSALHGVIQYCADPESKLPTLVYWLIGSFSGATAAKVDILAPAVLGAGAVLLLLRWRLNLLSLGDMDAEALGLKSGGLRWLIVALVALIVAAQVAVSGIVGWAGLIVPHFARMLVGPDHRRLLPAAALTGAIFLLAMDDIARTLLTQEVPIGILTAGIGTPIFAFLFWRTQTKGWNHD